MLEMPSLWTFVYGRVGVNNLAESSSGSDPEDDSVHNAANPSKEIDRKHKTQSGYSSRYGVQCSQKLRHLFLRRSAEMPVRMCIVSTVKYGWGQISGLIFTPVPSLSRIMQISFHLSGNNNQWFQSQSLLYVNRSPS